MRTNLIRRTTTALAAAFAMALAILLAPAPAHAAWGSQIPVSIQVVSNYGYQLGYASGWVQFDTGGTTFRYEITVCRQSSYTPPNLAVSVNTTNQNPTGTNVTTHYMNYVVPGGTAPCYGGSETFTGQHDRSPLSNVYFLLSGNTFVDGNNFTIFTQDRLVFKSYTY